jgi:endo-1,4-beta-D-glucanase Y
MGFQKNTLMQKLFALLLLFIPSICLADDSTWPDWDRFHDRFVQADGRVIDLTFDGKSTSEGQSYALFFALVANQRAQFDTILAWTSDNLADGQLGEKLPGWLWGKRDDGSWGIKDKNSASDADLWIAYSLLEAGRLWDSPMYTTRGKRVLALIREHEVVDAGSAGKLLLPGAIGFDLGGGRYRVNPSYLPGFMFRYLANVDAKGPWGEIWNSYLQLSPQIYAAGVAPDNIIVTSKGKVTQDTERADASGSYDAIRVYLWAGMSGKDGEDALRRLTPYAKLIERYGGPPEKVNPATGAVIKHDYQPIGFTGASLPFLAAVKRQDLIDSQENRLRGDALKAKLGAQTNYYDQVLILFGKGWHDGNYKFDERGQLVPKWH